MAEPAVTFNLGQGGLGRAGQSFDSYSAMIGYYNQASVNTAYAGIGNKIYNSIVDAATDGIVDTCAEATAATSTQLVATTGADGDKINITFPSFDGSVINLGTYTKITADSTVTLVAAGIIATVNAGSYIHGFTAIAGTAGQYILTATKRLGIYPNTKSTVNTITGTMTVTNAAFTGGTRSWLALWNYQIATYFKRNQAPLYFSIKFDATANNISAFNAQLITDITTVANGFAGQARQMAILSNGRTFATSTMDAIKTARSTLFSLYIPCEFLLVADNTATALSAQPNTRALSDAGVTFIAGQSGSGKGFELSKTQQQAIGAIGAALGTLSSAAVSQSIAEVGAFNLSDGVEFSAIPMFLDGTPYDVTNTSLNNQLNDYGYVYPKIFAGGITGTYFNNSSCAITPASDYAYIETNRTINKAVRGVYASILPLLNSRVTLNSNGTLSVQAIAAFQAAAGYPLTQMAISGDLSQDPSTNGGIIVSPTEVVSTSGKIPITIKLIPIGIARQIVITIGYVASI